MNRQRSRPSSSSITSQARSKVFDGSSLMFTRPFELGYYSPGTAPDRIPYHLYLLLKEAVNSPSLGDLERVEKKISFFCDFFYTHLPVGWKYDRDNAASLIAGCDTFFAKGDPKYNLSGYTPLGDPVNNNFDVQTLLLTKAVFEIMSLVHSRKTPTPRLFRDWGDAGFMAFYCKLCSCFGLEYDRLEAASEDDVILMDMGPRIAENNRFAAPSPYKIRDPDSDSDINTSSDDNSEDRHRRRQLKHSHTDPVSVSQEGSASHNQDHMKLNSNDEAFELSLEQIGKILRIVCSGRSPPLTKWNEYQTSFYFKMCSCFGVIYQHQEAA